MKLKAKKIRVWCKEVPTQITGCPGKGWAVGTKIKNSIKDKSGNIEKIPNRVVCPDCKKRFKPRVRQCFDHNCWHVYLPAHKKEMKIK